MTILVMTTMILLSLLCTVLSIVVILYFVKELYLDKDVLTLVVYENIEDGKVKFRWRLVARNNEIVATSGESFNSLQACMNNVALITKYAKTSSVIRRIKEKE